MYDQPLTNRIINHHPNGLSAAIQMDNQLLANRFINHHPNELSAAIQMDDQPLSNRFVNHHQMDYQQQSKWMINLYQTVLSTTIQMDY